MKGVTCPIVFLFFFWQYFLTFPCSACDVLHRMYFLLIWQKPSSTNSSPQVLLQYLLQELLFLKKGPGLIELSNILRGLHKKISSLYVDIF